MGRISPFPGRKSSSLSCCHSLFLTITGNNLPSFLPFSSQSIILSSKIHKHGQFYFKCILPPRRKQSNVKLIDQKERGLGSGTETRLGRHPPTRRRAYLGALFIAGHAIGRFAFCSERKHRAVIPATPEVSRLGQGLQKHTGKFMLFVPFVQSKP